MQSLKLYGYWRSSCSYRSRWALELKKVPYSYIPINLLKNQQRSPEHLARNPKGLVPVLEVSQGVYISESIAMMEWLDEAYPKQGVTLYPGTPVERAHIRQLCEIINAGTQPLINLSVINKVTEDLEKRKEWCRHWIRNGLKSFEVMSEQKAGDYSVGNSLTAADVSLIPQLFSAKRFDISLENEFPRFAILYERLLKTPECFRASPEQQSDAVPDSH